VHYNSSKIANIFLSQRNQFYNFCPLSLNADVIILQMPATSNLVYYVKNLSWLALPFSGYYVGLQLENVEIARQTTFRDKSALYGSRTPPAVPSWP